MRRLGIALLATTVAAVGCNLTINVPKRRTEATETTATTTATGPVDDRNTNYRPDQSGLRNAKRAAERMAQMTDFDQMKFFIFAYELENNRMPTIAEIKADLKQYPDARQILKKIDDGVIILTGTKDKNGLWAYEVDSDKIGGIICLGNSIKRATADEVKQLLGVR